MSLALLVRALRAFPIPTSNAVCSTSALPASTLRFVLEYHAMPNLDVERDKITAILTSKDFQFRPIANGLDRFLVLQFPQFGSVFNQQTLFAIGYELCNLLGLVSAEPDLDAEMYPLPDTPALSNGLEAGEVVGTWCTAVGDPPEDRLWALRAIRATDAWELARGGGVLIAQPDTGVAEHRALTSGMLRPDLGCDILSGRADPTDPMSAQSPNPGHGTATASVAASRLDGEMAGAAPAAQIVPIRCIEDVRVFNQAPIAAAISHAVSINADVITMSLGGVPSRALHASVKQAIDNGIIVLAAAGNCVQTVVWPARYDEVIAVGGINAAGKPWRGSCRGSAVDICAPAEFVWRARRIPGSEITDLVEAGQGTSYAVALVAGVAALWLSRHGTDQVRSMAAQRGCSVQRLFKSAIQATARGSRYLEAGKYGAGIVDAHALLRLALNDISVETFNEAKDLADPIGSVFADEIGLVESTSLDWRRFGTEVATIALAQRRTGESLSTLSPETKSSATAPSPQLAAALRGTADPVWSQFGKEPLAIARPFFEARPFATPTGGELRQALALTHTGLESTAERFNPGQARAYLSSGGIQQEMDRLQRVVATEPALLGISGRELISAAEQALNDTARALPLTSNGRFGFEALVRLTGRPALRCVNGDIDLNDPRASEWYDRLYMLRASGELCDRIRAVGRIDIGGVHVGTGFVVDNGLVLTNRHVLQLFASPLPQRENPSEWLMHEVSVTIDFADEPSPVSTLRFPITGVIGAGPRAIRDTGLDFGALDAAILEVGTAGGTFPKPVPLPRQLVDGDPAMLVVGYPARPTHLPRRVDGRIDEDVAKRLIELFPNYSIKYLCPGDVTGTPSGLLGAQDAWILRHDATTLGGSSGSAVFGFGRGIPGIGLHFAGTWLRENYAHSMAMVAQGSNILSSTLPWK